VILARSKPLLLTQVTHVDWHALAALFLLPAPLVLPLLRPGLPNSADSAVHLFRTGAMAQALADGVLYPRWAADFYLGYGYPFFNFYAPGVHYLAALLMRAGLSAVTALVIVQALALATDAVSAALACEATARVIVITDDELAAIYAYVRALPAPPSPRPAR